ncbi:hypothetical protein [Burkholderia sp. L27(2015)]|uniref:hypothetical protein n=1 Tax=Burkholderia sp. L27(2015) TaxID=1641858 RepID=UPI00131E9444|nr:hypothetical protein [Burkholderia sp. L27(2015)]
MESKQPLIFSVLCFSPIGETKFKLDVHYVAGFDSADAEQRIVTNDSAHLVGRRFINTDGLMEHHPKPTCLYATRYTNVTSISEQEFSNWVRQMTVDNNNDGER